MFRKRPVSPSDKNLLFSPSPARQGEAPPSGCRWPRPREGRVAVHPCRPRCHAVLFRACEAHASPKYFPPRSPFIGENLGVPSRDVCRLLGGRRAGGRNVPTQCRAAWGTGLPRQTPRPPAEDSPCACASPRSRSPCSVRGAPSALCDRALPPFSSHVMPRAVAPGHRGCPCGLGRGWGRFRSLGLGPYLVFSEKQSEGYYGFFSFSGTKLFSK